MAQIYDLKYFMREELKEDEVVEVEGVSTFKDNNGNIIPFKIKRLGIDKINELRKKYSINKVLADDKGKRILDKSGKPIIEKEIDDTRLTNRMIVEALVFPDLKDKELMKFYGCFDIDDMPFKVFKRSKDYQYIASEVLKVLGIGEEEPSDDELINQAKN